MKKLLLILLFLCSKLYAQDTLFKSSVEELMHLKILQDNLQEVSTVSQTTEDITDVPANIVIVTAEQIVQRGYEDISDLLKDMPAVDLTENARAVGEYYTIRGINGNDRFLILINGRKVNAISGTYLSVGNSISIRLAKRIEIVYGASSVAYGSDAFSCVINIITEEAMLARKFTGQLAYGKFNTIDAFIQNTLALSKDIKVHAFGRIYHSDGFSPKNEGVFANIANYPNPLNNKFEQKIKDHTIFLETKYKNFKVGYFRQYFNEGNGWGISPATYVMSKENAWVVHHNIFWVNYEKRFKNGNTLFADISYTLHNLDEGTKFSILNNVNSPLSRQYMTGKDRNGRLAVHYSGKIFQKIDFVLGLQGENAFIVPAYANDHLFGEPKKYIGAVADEIDKKLTINERKLGIFGQFRYDFSKKLNLTAALRYDFSKQFDDVLNPRLALIFKATKHLFAKIIYGTAFQAPSFFYQYEQFSNAGAIMIPNALQDFRLQNQKIESIEFDLNYKKDRLFLNFNVFYSLANNLIERRTYPTSVFNPFAGRHTIGFRNENNGEQTAYGLVLRTQWQLKDNIQFWGHYTFSNASFLYGKDFVEKDLPRISQHKFFTGLTFQRIFKLVDAFVSYKWVSDISPIASATTGKIAGHSILNTTVSVHAFRYFRFFAQSSRLFGNANSVGLYDGGIYTPTIQQADWQGRLGIGVNF